MITPPCQKDTENGRRKFYAIVFWSRFEGFVRASKERSQKETVNDLHGDIINLAIVLQDPERAPKLYERLQTVLYSEEILQYAWEWIDYRTEDCDPVEWAYQYFLACWMSRNGTAGTERMDYQIAVRWTNGGGSPTVRFRNAVDSIPHWHERLRNVVILKRNAFDIIDRFEDAPGTAIYVDPPYARETRGKSGGSGRYRHEFAHSGDLLGPDDHERLAKELRSYKHARVIVSYYDCPRIRALYSGWTVVEHTRQKLLHAANGRGARPKEAPEILIINGPSIENLVASDRHAINEGATG